MSRERQAYMFHVKHICLSFCDAEKTLSDKSKRRKELHTETRGVNYLRCFFRSGGNQKTNGKRPLMIFHERSRFAACQWEFSKPTDISIPSTA